MLEQLPSSRMIRFGVFEVDLAAGELRKSGVKIKLQDQPFRVLVALLARPGEVVTREELREKLWRDGTFVDFDRGVNTAINKIRDALGDSADTPRFVETLPRRGYRFLGNVEGARSSNASVAGPAAAAVPRQGEEQSASARPIRPTKAAVGLAALALFVGALTVLWFRGPESGAERPLRKFSIRSPETLWIGAFGSWAAVSPDGAHIAFTPNKAGPIWVQDLDRLEPRVVEGTEGARYLFWSPNSHFIGFLTDRDVRKIAVQGGPPAVVCSFSLGQPRGATWSPDGNSIVFGAGFPTRLYEAAAGGGSPTLLFEPAEGEETLSFQGPRFLQTEDEGRVILYSLTRAGEPQLVVRNLDTGATQELGSGALPFYSNGHIVYQTSFFAPGLWALPFSLKNLTPRGEPFSLDPKGWAASAAGDGTLVYLGAPSLEETQLFWLDRAGRKLGEVATPYRDIGEPQLSPDGRQVAFATNPDGDIYVHDLTRRITTRLSATPVDESRPAWSPSGREVAFSRSQSALFIRAADGSAEEETLLDTSAREIMCDWSRDGRYIAYTVRDSVNEKDLWYLKRKADGGWESFPFLQAPSSQVAARFSPDGRFIAYCSDESGRHEVYVRPFPEGEGRWQVSNRGGGQPRWSRDGKELFYVEGDAMMAVPVITRPSFQAHRAERLFQHSHTGAHTGAQYGGFTRYDVSPDGQRFLVVEPVGDQPDPSIIVVQNWFEEFRDKKTES